MRPRTVRRWYVLMAFGWLIAAVLFGAGVAKADDVAGRYAAAHGGAICAGLKAGTSTAVDQVVAGILADGLTERQTAEALYSAVAVWCPMQLAALEQWANPVYVAGHVGGALR